MTKRSLAPFCLLLGCALAVPAAGQSGDLEWLLRRTVTLTGTITDPAGRPVAGISLWAITGIMPGQPSSPPAATSGPDGRFVIANLFPDESRDRFSCDYGSRGLCPSGRNATSDSEGRFEMGPLAPGVYDLTTRSGAGETTLLPHLPVRAGESIEGLEIRLDRGEPATEVGSLVVLVVDTAGRPISGATVLIGLQLYEEGDPERPSWRVMTAADGIARFAGLPDERLWLLTEKDGFIPDLRAHFLDAATPGDLQVALLPGGVSVGRVTDEAGRPVAGVEVEISGRVFGTWFADLPAFLRNKAKQRTRTGLAGRFRFHDLPEIRFELSLRHSSYSPFLADDPIQGGQSGDLGRFVLHRGRMLSGNVTDPDGRPVAGIPIWAITRITAGEDNLPPATRSGPNGSFAISNFPPGEVDLWACGKEHEHLHQSLTVRFPSERLDLTLQPAAMLRGRVLGPDGRPRAGIDLFAVEIGAGLHDGFRLGPCPLEGAATSDSEGRFEIGPLAPGWYDITAHAGAREQGILPHLQVLRGESIEELEIHLERGTSGPQEEP